MKLHTNKKGILILGLSVMAVASVPALAWAHITEDGSAHSHNNETSLREEAKSLRDEMRQKGEEKKQAAKESRDAKKAAKCEERKQRIDELMSRIDTRSQRTFDRLTKISEMVQSYVKEKQLSVEGYDTLVADINTKKTQADTKLNMMLTHHSFSCEASNPRETVQEYRTARQAKVAAMKAYRQSIRALVVEVKQTVTSEEEN